MYLPECMCNRIEIWTIYTTFTHIFNKLNTANLYINTYTLPETNNSHLKTGPNPGRKGLSSNGIHVLFTKILVSGSAYHIQFQEVGFFLNPSYQFIAAIHFI